MRLRLRLALAFLLLSALPLAGLALYSYHASSQALRRAAEAEAELMARELELRVEGVAEDVDQRVRALARLPSQYWTGDKVETPDAGERKVLSEFASALPFLEGLQFVPAPAAAPATEAGGATVPPAPAPKAAPVLPTAAVAGAGPTRIVFSLPTPGGDGLETETVQRELEKVKEVVARAIAESASLRRLAAEERAAEAQARRLEKAELRATNPGALARRVELQSEQSAAATPGDAAAASPASAPADAPYPSDVSCSVHDGDLVVGQLTAKIKAKELLRSVLRQTDRAEGEIPFALDEANTLFVAESADGERLRSLAAIEALKSGATVPAHAAGDDWVVVTRNDPATGYRFGIARPISHALAELKTTTARNFAYGLGLVGLALVGMVPLSSSLLKNVRALETGAARIAAGDLTTRVPIRSRDEFGELASSFNRMAAQLSENQERLLREERLRKEQEIERALLSAENERRGRELEEARRFQLSLLPKELPARPGLELAVSMTTATEVGGDYYDFLECPDGSLLLAIGDATGHGAAAGTMVTAVKSLFTAGAAAAAPASFLSHATAVVHSMALHRMAMALAVGRLDGRVLTLSSAGMPPALHYDVAAGRVREIVLPGTPLGSRAEFPYREARLELAPGDALLLLSDGLPELPDASGEPFGYERLRARFQDAAAKSACEIVDVLRDAATRWSGGAAPGDDATFLVLKAERT